MRSWLISACCLASSLLQAQNHYAPGVEGLKGASLPPPGLYIKDYNYVYFAGQVNDNTGSKIPVDFNITAYVNAIRPVWITKYQLLGGNYGADILVPFVYQDLKVGAAKDSSFGLGDIFIEPATLSWHKDKYDLAVAVGVWAPSGEFKITSMTNPGKGFWTPMLTLGGTWYPTEDKSWAASILNRYEFHTKNSDANMTPGQTFTVEWGLSKTFNKTIDVGLAGYYQKETTAPSMPGPGPKFLYQAVGVGPEINLFCTKLKLFVSARYAREFAAENQTEGNVFCLTLTKIW